MAKKETEKVFDIEQALKECPKPEWYKKAFTKTMDCSKIKNDNDLKKAFKTYGEMK